MQLHRATSGGRILNNGQINRNVFLIIEYDTTTWGNHPQGEGYQRCPVTAAKLTKDHTVVINHVVSQNVVSRGKCSKILVIFPNTDIFIKGEVIDIFTD